MAKHPTSKLPFAPDLERDLSFEPVVNPSPKCLTAQQIDFYNEHGYVKPFRIFDDDQITKIRTYFDALIEQIKQSKDGRDTYAINGYQTQCRGIYDLIKTQLILDYVEDLVGPDIVCWGTHYFCKMPGDTKTVPWHQDAAYWPFDKSRTITAWLAINDADVENGCMHVIPGTHKVGQLKWNEVEGQVLDRQIENAEQYGEAVPFELKAGEISLHADMLAHGSGPNLSTRPRGGLTMRYCPVSVRGEWNTTSVICRGNDDSGHWSDIPRPEGEDPRPKEYQVQVNAG